MQNSFPNSIAQAERNISYHLETPENTKFPRFLGRAVILPSAWEGSLALQGGSLFGLSILLLLYVFHVPLRACLPFHRASLGCAFNRYRDDSHRFIAALWEIPQCEIIAVFHVENKMLRLRKSTSLHHWELCIMENFWPVENNPLRCNGRSACQKQSPASYKTTLYEVMAQAEIGTNDDIIILLARITFSSSIFY
ncbi:hypothetical protein Tsp_03408 [Trichinella spiralis]|uniref:hypothetical protein n=1 Tax=Trichinella spiralis TaxID=6334 RepID=UPI0001EFCDBB|nr:hypothetical protein Tsp_03408 [Trichinella spiralis]